MPRSAAALPVEGRLGGSFCCDIQPFFVLGLAALLLLFSTPSWASSPKLSFLIGKVARQEGLDPNLLSAVVATESQFDIASVSVRGAVGLMQLMPDTARELGVVNRFNPEQNLRGGARYLRRLIERYPDNLSLALAAYNAGPTAVIRFGGVPPFPETKRYIDKVLGRYAKMVPGRNKSPKKIHYHIRDKKSYGAPVSVGSRHVARPLGPTHAPKLARIPDPPTQRPVRRTEFSKRRSGDAPVIRLTRR